MYKFCKSCGKDMSCEEESEQETEEEEEELGMECEECDEGRLAKVTRGEYAPTKEEVERHMATHVPFRSWCRH